MTIEKKRLNVLVACEFSGRVRDAFIARGHNAISVDLLPTESPGPHFQGDIFEFLKTNPPESFDLLIAHPPCTYLAISGSHRVYTEPGRWEKVFEALDFVERLMKLPIPQTVIENPVSLISTWIKKPSQIIQPWQFGHGETKKTCLWLKNLPLLKPTEIVNGREPKILNMRNNAERAKNRSVTYKGIANAMAAQWSEDLTK